jgi:hypothetical protein
MEKTFKIINSNKMVRRGFTSLDEVKKFVEDNGLFPEYGREEILIEETTVETHKIESKLPPILSDLNKIKLIDILKENGSSIVIDPHWSPIYSAFEEDWSGNKITHNLYLKDLVRRFLEENFNLPKEEIADTFLKIKDFNTDYTKIVDKGKLSRLVYSHILDDFNSNPDDFEFLKINTNYKPCSSISLYHKKSKMYFQIRPGDIFFTTWQVYGRNTSVTKVANASDKDIKEFKSKIII